MKIPNVAASPLMLALIAFGAAAQQAPEPPIVTQGYRPTLTPPLAPAAVARAAQAPAAVRPGPPAPAAAGPAAPAPAAEPAPSATSTAAGPAAQAAAARPAPAAQPAPPARKPQPRRSVQAVIESMPVKPPLVTEGDRPSLVPPAPSPSPPGPTTVNSCDAGGCTDVGGTRYNSGGGDASVSGQGRLCNRNGTTIQCF